MILVYLFIFGIFFLLSSTFRCIVFNPFSTIWYALKDTFFYFKHKKYNNAKYGFVDCYTAHDSKAFGCGKTLTAVDYCYRQYKKYDGKKVWDEKKKKFVKQKVYILSNVDFIGIPYIKLTGMGQFVSLCEERYKKDKEEDICSVIIMLIDECGAAYNSRSFRDNFNPMAIKTLLTARHYKASCILTAQRFSMCDALWRSVVNRVIACDKWLRFQRLNYFDGYTMETAQNPALVKPYKKTCWFIKDKAFERYDTFQLLSDIKKSCEEGDMLSEQEILINLGNTDVNMDGVLKPSKKFVKTKKKMYK